METSANQLRGYSPLLVASLQGTRHVDGPTLAQFARDRAIAPITYPRGVVKFRNIQEAQAGRAARTPVPLRDLRPGSPR